MVGGIFPASLEASAIRQDSTAARTTTTWVPHPCAAITEREPMMGLQRRKGGNLELDFAIDFA